MSGGNGNEEDDDRTGVEVIEGMDDSIPQIGTPLPLAPVTENATAAVDRESLLQFSYVVRYRVGKDFAAGPYEGRLKLELGEYVCSGKTQADVESQLAAKAVAVLAKRAALAKKIADRQA